MVSLLAEGCAGADFAVGDVSSPHEVAHVGIFFQYALLALSSQDTRDASSGLTWLSYAHLRSACPVLLHSHILHRSPRLLAPASPSVSDVSMHFRLKSTKACCVSGTHLQRQHLAVRPALIVRSGQRGCRTACANCEECSKVIEECR